MKNIFFILCLTPYLSCNAQHALLKDLSDNTTMNYTFAFIDKEEIQIKTLYNETLYIKIFKVLDPHATPDDFSPTDGQDVLESFIISVKSSDLYSKNIDSKLYKLEGFYRPKILNIKEISYPEFMIEVEHTKNMERRVDIFRFKSLE